MGAVEVWVAMRRSVTGAGEPLGVILNAAASVWLPVPMPLAFEFLRNEQTRREWDILTSGSVVSEMGRIPIGVDHGNCVSLLKVQQAAAGPGAQTNMLILQETTFDPSGALIVYAPVDIPAMKEVISGGSSDSVALLPSGFSLLPDCALSSDQRVALFHAAPVQPTAGGAASAAFAGGAVANGGYGADEGWQQGGEVDSLAAQAMRSAARKRALGHVPEGSILTVSFQILVSPNPQV
ncbi:unnamed protein product [Closterium sp. Yama58-4]|nr:unnamed protein product [Closterium sp. Yama58-4]